LHQQHGGRHQLRDAGERAAAARVRPGQGGRRGDRGAAGEGGGEDGVAGRQAANAGAGRPGDRRQGEGDGDRRGDGRGGVGGQRVDEAGAAGGGELPSEHRAAIRQAARASHGGIAPVRAGRRRRRRALGDRPGGGVAGGAGEGDGAP